MFRRTAFTFILVLLGARLEGAALLRGIVLQNEVGGPPLAGVQVGVSAGANTTASDQDGKFIFKFPDKQPGEIVRLIVKKPGYVVVNDVQLRLALPMNPDAEPLVILLCRQRDREDMARRFYRLKSFAAISESYRRRLKELQASKQATLRALAKLRQDRDRARAAAERAAEDLARLRPGQTSALHEEAMRLFLARETQKALEVLDEDKLRRSLLAARGRRAQAEMAIAQVVRSYLLRGDILITQLRFEDALDAYQQAYDAAPEDLRASFKLAYLSTRLKRYPMAVSAYERCLRLAGREGTRAQVAIALMNLGGVHFEQNRLDEAGSAYAESLRIRRLSLFQWPETYLRDVAEALHNVGVVRCEQGRLDEARANLEEALGIVVLLARSKPETYRVAMSREFSALGSVYFRENRLGEACSVLEKGLELFWGGRETLPVATLEQMEPLALQLHNLGVARTSLGQMCGARKSLQSALNVRRWLAEQAPEIYLLDVANTLRCLADVHREERRTEDARNAYEEALGIYKQYADGGLQSYAHAVREIEGHLKHLDRSAPPSRCGPLGPLTLFVLCMLCARAPFRRPSR